MEENDGTAPGAPDKKSALMLEAGDTSIFSSELEVVTGVCLEEKPGRPSDRMVLKISKKILKVLGGFLCRSKREC